MQFMDSSLDKLVKNLVDKDFKYLVNYVLESIFIVQQKIKKLVMMVKYQMVM